MLKKTVSSVGLIPKADLGDLLLDFFDFYGNKFNYDNSIISLTGIISEKLNMSIRGNPNNQETALLRIEDPQNKINNVGKAAYQFGKVIFVFKNAVKVLGIFPFFHIFLSRIIHGRFHGFGLRKNFTRKLFSLPPKNQRFLPFPPFLFFFLKFVILSDEKLSILARSTKRQSTLNHLVNIDRREIDQRNILIERASEIVYGTQNSNNRDFEKTESFKKSRDSEFPQKRATKKIENKQSEAL